MKNRIICLKKQKEQFLNEPLPIKRLTKRGRAFLAKFGFTDKVAVLIGKKTLFVHYYGRRWVNYISIHTIDGKLIEQWTN